MRFADRSDAGRRLAARLGHLREAAGVVLGIPRGGVVVAAEIAASLGWPLDVVIARKVGAPFNPELALAAVAPGGVLHFNRELLEQLRLRPEDLAPLVALQLREIERRLRLYRGGRPPLSLGGKVAVLADDGVATGLTVAAAAESVRRSGPASLILAVPVASQEALASLRPLADEIVCLETPDDFYAVGEFYRNFRQVTDDEVMALLREHGRGAGQEPPGGAAPTAGEP